MRQEAEDRGVATAAEGKVGKLNGSVKAIA